MPCWPTCGPRWPGWRRTRRRSPAGSDPSPAADRRRLAALPRRPGTSPRRPPRWGPAATSRRGPKCDPPGRRPPGQAPRTTRRPPRPRRATSGGRSGRSDAGLESPCSLRRRPPGAVRRGVRAALRERCGWRWPARPGSDTGAPGPPRRRPGRRSPPPRRARGTPWPTATPAARRRPAAAPGRAPRPRRSRSRRPMTGRPHRA